MRTSEDRKRTIFKTLNFNPLNSRGCGLKATKYWSFFVQVPSHEDKTQVLKSPSLFHLLGVSPTYQLAQGGFINALLN